LKYEGDILVDWGRKGIEKLQQTYGVELADSSQLVLFHRIKMIAFRLISYMVCKKVLVF
jgi:hypothetical protein